MSLLLYVENFDSVFEKMYSGWEEGKHPLAKHHYYRLGKRLYLFESVEEDLKKGLCEPLGIQGEVVPFNLSALRGKLLPENLFLEVERTVSKYFKNLSKALKNDPRKTLEIYDQYSSRVRGLLEGYLLPTSHLLIFSREELSTLLEDSGDPLRNMIVALAKTSGDATLDALYLGCIDLSFTTLLRMLKISNPFFNFRKEPELCIAETMVSFISEALKRVKK